MKKNAYKITILFEPGSDFQAEVGTSALNVMLKSWRDHYESSHKKNQIVIEWEKGEK